MMFSTNNSLTLFDKSLRVLLSINKYVKEKRGETIINCSKKRW